MRSVIPCVETETHEKINTEVYEENLYELDKTSLDEKEIQNCTFEN